MISWGKHLFIIISFFLLIPNSAFAQSDYVLPYPSSMPGSGFYKVQFLIDNLQKYWYFGNLSQFSYNLQLSDKYLVEAKTLFEYKQYLLALKALKKSDSYFALASHHLQKAHAEGKDISEKQIVFNSAMQKHKEVLLQIRNSIPQEFVWQAEKEQKQYLRLWEDIDMSVKTKESCI